MIFKEYNVGDRIEWHRLAWSSDWNGYEVGYPGVPVVGLYSDRTYSYYINTETQTVLEKWKDDEEEF